LSHAVKRKPRRGACGKNTADRAANSRTKAVFVDRDGTLNEMVYDRTHGLLDSPRRPEQVRLRPGAAAFLAGARRAGFVTVVVTNQPGIAKGTLMENELRRVHARLAALLRREDSAARWDDIRVCPHHPEGGPFARRRWVRTCRCRKPQPGLLLQAARDLNLDLSKSWMVGDGLNDIQAGRAAGCRTILVTKLKLEHIERFLGRGGVEPDYIVPDLLAALRVIRKDRGRAT
jgi:D-glycero-D-manno-heptose 1,7-bisphosphate phosphatase